MTTEPVTEAVQLLDLPHREARRLLAEDGAVVFLGVNPVEFHGPHLSLHNDRLISEGLSRDLHAALLERRGESPFLVGGDLELGCEPASGPGSRHAKLSTLRDAVNEAVRALHELGARRLVINTFHGGALHNLALDEGVRTFERLGGRAIAPLAIALLEMVDVRAETFDEALQRTPCTASERHALREALRFDFHAGWLETSLALHYAPGSVSPCRARLPPGPKLGRDAVLGFFARAAGALGRKALSTELDFLATASTWTKVRPFPAYTSRPDLASAAAGASIAARFVERYAEASVATLDHGAPPPRPPFAYLRALTLEGRLQPSFVPTSEVLAE